MADDKERSERVREANDQFRRHPQQQGRVVMTNGVDAEGPAFALQALGAAQAFSAFSEDNDPYGEHDFGSFELDGKKLFWKIDCYEKGSNYTAGADTPENPATTDRVLTIMFAQEY